MFTAYDAESGRAQARKVALAIESEVVDIDIEVGVLRST